MRTPPIAVQRFAVWWTEEGRGARSADVRRGLPDAFPLPGLPDPGPGTPVLLHDVDLREENAYVPQETVRYAALTGVPWCLRLREHGGLLTVARSAPDGWEAFPRRWPRTLFTLRSGEVGRYRANFRFTVGRDAGRLYGDWTLRVGHGAWHTGAPAADVDDRTRLYGG
ncbi:hypothetical protein [Nocardiopsis flavescens]